MLLREAGADAPMAKRGPVQAGHSVLLFCKEDD